MTTVAATVSFGWKDAVTIITFLSSVAGLGWWLARQFGWMRETLGRMEEREKGTVERLGRMEDDFERHAERSEKAQARLQDDVGKLRERVAVIESRTPLPHSPPPNSQIP